MTLGQCSLVPSHCFAQTSGLKVSLLDQANEVGFSAFQGLLFKITSSSDLPGIKASDGLDGIPTGSRLDGKFFCKNSI